MVLEQSGQHHNGQIKRGQQLEGLNPPESRRRLDNWCGYRLLPSRLKAMVQRPVEVEADDDLQFRLLEQELPSWHPPYIFAALDTLFAVPSTIICIDSLFYAPEAHIMYLTASS